MNRTRRSEIIRRQFCVCGEYGLFFEVPLGLLAAGDVSAYFAVLVVERQWGSYPSVIVFLLSFLLRSGWRGSLLSG